MVDADKRIAQIPERIAQKLSPVDDGLGIAGAVRHHEELQAHVAGWQLHRARLERREAHEKIARLRALVVQTAKEERPGGLAP